MAVLIIYSYFRQLGGFFMKLIAVTSPATDAGKTFIAAGIAEAATYHNLKTLFMDFDNPCLLYTSRCV